MEYQTLLNECNDISAEIHRLENALNDLATKFRTFESKVDSVEKPTGEMFKEFIELKKEHLRTKWIQLKILHRRQRLKENIMLFKLASQKSL